MAASRLAQTRQELHELRVVAIQHQHVGAEPRHQREQLVELTSRVRLRSVQRTGLVQRRLERGLAEHEDAHGLARAARVFTLELIAHVDGRAERERRHEVEHPRDPFARWRRGGSARQRRQLELRSPQGVGGGGEVQDVRRRGQRMQPASHRIQLAARFGGRADPCQSVADRREPLAELRDKAGARGRELLEGSRVRIARHRTQSRRAAPRRPAVSLTSADPTSRARAG